ncbi:MAG: Ldh family oxidoreductase [Burkholderiaceae bacterium]
MKHDANRLERWTTEVFAACGLPAADAALAAGLLVRSELRGYHTHGVTRIGSYVDRLHSGEFKARPVLREQSFAGGIVLDTDGAMGQIAGPRAIELGLAALEHSASVLITLRSCGHLGALGIHALIAAEAGAFCLVGQRTPPLLSLPGFSQAAIGHNPIAFGCPRPGGDPLVFDIACSVAARGHILLAAREGRPIPEGWALDEHGQPTTDAEAALKGSLLPTGGHKGIGLAMMVECLAGAMAAHASSLQPEYNELPRGGAVGGQGAFFWLVRPGAFVDESVFAPYMTQWTDRYLQAGSGRARLPGARGAQLEADGRAHGLALPPAIEAELAQIGERLGVPFPR